MTIETFVFVETAAEGYPKIRHLSHIQSIISITTDAIGVKFGMQQETAIFNDSTKFSGNSSTTLCTTFL